MALPADVNGAPPAHQTRSRMEEEVTYWFWLNIPLATAIFLAIVGIPLWLVIKRPEAEPAVIPAVSANSPEPPVRALELSRL